MANNKKNPETVITSIDPSNIGNLSEEAKQELLRSLLHSMPVTQRAKVVAEESTAIKTEVSAEVTALQKRNAEIDAEIERLTAHLRAEKRENITRLSDLNVKSASGETRTREVTECPSCGQSRHAENEKTAGCTLYPSFKAAQSHAKENKLPVPTFGQFLAARAKAANVA